MHMYAYVYVCMYMYTYICQYMYTVMCMYMYICLSIYVCVFQFLYVKSGLCGMSHFSQIAQNQKRRLLNVSLQ